jgi:hypothetical protein
MNDQEERRLKKLLSGDELSPSYRSFLLASMFVLGFLCGMLWLYQTKIVLDPGVKFFTQP